MHKIKANLKFARRALCSPNLYIRPPLPLIANPKQSRKAPMLLTGSAVTLVFRTVMADPNPINQAATNLEMDSK